jgi:hypothetical protein
MEDFGNLTLLRGITRAVELPQHPLALEREKAPALPAGPLIVNSAGFLAGFTPPDYLIDGILQRGFCYSMTAPTGTGKTAIALTFAAHVAMGSSLDKIDVEQGRVLYLAGENPDDIRMRWIACADKLGSGYDRGLLPARRVQNLADLRADRRRDREDRPGSLGHRRHVRGLLRGRRRERQCADGQSCPAVAQPGQSAR